MKYFAAILFLMISSLSNAEDWVRVSDMSQLKWQMQSSTGKVYLRNLNTFDNSFLDCCYNYHIETTTDEGKAVWSVILSYMVAGKPLWLGVSDKTKPGSITYFGEW